MQDRLAATLAFDASVSALTGVSSGRAAAFLRLGIETVRDLVQHYPRRYIDMTRLDTIEHAPLGERVTIIGEVHEVVLKRPRRDLSLVEVTVVDGTGTLIVTFFKQPWLQRSIRQGMRVGVSGELEFNYGYKRMKSPFLDVIDEGGPMLAGSIIPVHGATEKVSAGIMRKVIRAALASIQGCFDPLPLRLRTRYRLMSRAAALASIHFPQTADDIAQAKRRLAYEELLLLEMHLLASARSFTQGKAAHVHVFDGPFSRALSAALPFSLTDDQLRAVADIQGRMATDSAMSHLLLGDVGTGKTIVAAFAAAAAADARAQTLMMAPTEVLASQYARALGPLFDAAGITWALLTGSTPDADRRDMLALLESGHIDVLFGTHALIEPDVVCHDCGLVIVDEQQRFGVRQRADLLAKGVLPDALYMTATPIPRTLALALYGNLSLSYLKDMPENRPGRTTHVLGFRERGRAYDAVRAACAKGGQAFVICPLVGTKPPRDEGAHPRPRDDEADREPFIDSFDDLPENNVRAAEAEAAFLQAKVFKEFRVGLLHGKMKPAEKEEAMARFRAGGIDVLVATTVVEVGVDVPNATCMVVEDAERFGLSQLHQLRGRVGRGGMRGEVYLVAATSSDEALERLSAMEATDDGFELAERDLALRREGDILGNRQHGASALKLVNIMRDGALIEAAHADAAELADDDSEEGKAVSALLLHEAEVVFGPATPDAVLGG